MAGTSFRLRRFIVGNAVCRFLLQRQFYVFLTWGVITFLQAVLFALAGEYRYSLIFLLCLLLLWSGPERQLCRTLKEQERGDTRPGYVWKSALQEMSFTVPVGSHIDDGEHHKINRLSRFFLLISCHYLFV